MYYIMPKTSKAYRKMMKEIMKSKQTVKQKITEKKKSLQTPSAAPSKLDKF
jgi:hypothetical protein